MQLTKKSLKVCGKGGIIKMNKKQYNNIIEHTLKQEKTDDSLIIARAIFNNMGVALPQGDIKEVCEVLKTDNYMGWESCTMKEAQDAADNGTAAIGISESRIVVLSATNKEQPMTQTSSVMSLTENTSAYAMDELSYYAYGRTRTTSPITYCGGSNYRDVTRHNMILQSDGYYVCSRCGYRVKSPELEDFRILSMDDYLMVFSCLMFYAYLEVYRQKFPSVSDFELSQNTALQLVTEIRQKNNYTNQYLYSDGNGKCVGPNINYKPLLSFVEVRDLNIFNIGNFNGLNNAINDLVTGIFCPTIAMTQTILDLITHQMSGIDFSALVLDLFGYSNIANGLSMVSAVMDATNTGINTDDILIVVKLNGAIQGNFIFSPTGEFKMVQYTN